MDTSLDDIALFVEVAKRKSFSRAADALEMPVSTLSRRINELERVIAVRLLNRSTRKIELTEAGSVYFERCQHIVAEARIAHEQLLEVAQQPKGRLRISMPTSFSVSFMPAILRGFCELYPDIECEIDLGISPIDLLADSFDIVFRFGAQPDSGVISRRISNVAVCLYASSFYLARHGTPAVPADRWVPSVDVLFRSAANAVADRALGLVLTGMGKDGVEGARALRAVKAPLWCESALTAAVDGMPASAAAAHGAADRVPLDELALLLARALEVS